MRLRAARDFFGGLLRLRTGCAACLRLLGIVKKRKLCGGTGGLFANFLERICDVTDDVIAFYMTLPMMSLPMMSSQSACHFKSLKEWDIFISDNVISFDVITFRMTSNADKQLAPCADAGDLRRSPWLLADAREWSDADAKQRQETCCTSF
ncbi:hypothetical protein KUCAC02_001084 [Chaenocephalus aceratus]|uniref:Uncharacterized protein n=1 Tax=Chaenocephalus aceratus TaxID=36190 RepID=A0ACB9XWL1_CHAAC|nr:hypothetical protein KUCAC02_001084 [Chaenocephalus aceratus]